MNTSVASSESKSTITFPATFQERFNKHQHIPGHRLPPSFANAPCFANVAKHVTQLNHDLVVDET